jgi:alpha-pyrone synthase
VFSIVLVQKLFEEKNVQEKVYPVIMGMATGNPKYEVPQQAACKIAQKAQNCERVAPILERVYNNSRINTRHLAIPDFTCDNEGDDRFFPNDGTFDLDVQTRLDKFREVAVPLVTRVAKEAIQNSGVAIEDITKIVVVSSTGFLGPGLDCALIDNLGLNRSTDRSLIGFMGCAAAMNGFRIANDYVKVNPDKYALLVCVEISSVHTTFEDNINDAILHAIFADGCASAVIGGMTPSAAPKGTLAIYDDFSWLCENTEEGITLAINHNGISCTLSKHLATYIKQNMKFYIDTFLSRTNTKREEVDFWCVHPGGTRIIESVQSSLGLTEEDTADSWAVLGKYGNMLSPSVMYVFQRVFERHNAALARGEEGYKCGLAFSFSPGIGVEGIMLRQI